MSLRFEILGLLSYGDDSGYNLTKRINSTAMFFWQAQQSQVYRELQKLDEDAFIATTQESTDHKKMYKITETGTKALIEWLNTKETLESVEIRNPLVMKLFFSYNADRDKTIDMLNDYILECQNRLDEIADGKDELMEFAKNKQDQVFFSLNSFYGVGFYNFSIEWAQKCIGVLTKLKSL